MSTSGLRNVLCWIFLTYSSMQMENDTRWFRSLDQIQEQTEHFNWSLWQHTPGNMEGKLVYELHSVKLNRTISKGIYWALRLSVQTKQQCAISCTVTYRTAGGTVALVLTCLTLNSLHCMWCYIPRNFSPSALCSFKMIHKRNWKGSPTVRPQNHTKDKLYK